jgi:hypothetical protein
MDADCLIASDVVRGVSRLLLRHDLIALPEVSLSNGRRADLVALSPKGEIVIVEIKVSRADLLSDAKWPEYLGYCDRYFWAVPNGFDLTLFAREALAPAHTGLIVADRYDAAIVRDASSSPMPAARRRVETLHIARRGALRLLASYDSEIFSEA